MGNPGKSGTAPLIGVKHQKVFGLPVAHDIIFSNHKQKYKPRVEKRQRKLIIKLPFLRPFLNADEKILLITTGYSPATVLEKLGIGWLFIYLKRSLLVFTDRRIFHIPTTSIYKYRNSIAQIPYASCKSIQVKGRKLLMNYKAGEGTEKFFGLSGREKKKIRELLKIVSFDGVSASVVRRVHLCQRCAALLTVWGPQCRNCKLPFKTGTVATILAILFPGGGYYYLRQPFLGTITALIEIFAGTLVGVSLYDLFTGASVNLLWLGGGILLLTLIKAFAIAHARIIVGEFVPRKKTITFQSPAASSA